MLDSLHFPSNKVETIPVLSIEEDIEAITNPRYVLLKHTHWYPVFDQ